MKGSWFKMRCSHVIRLLSVKRVSYFSLNLNSRAQNEIPKGLYTQSK